MTDPTKMMKALVKDGQGVSLRPTPRPTLRTQDDVLIRVVMAGVCRTDVYVAQGHIPCREGLILGHEFSGIVEAAGPAVRRVALGDRVTVMPWIPCGACQECLSDAPSHCTNSGMLGVDHHGAFAEWIVVSASIVYRLHPQMPFKVGAYIEPIAASLAVLKAGLQPQERGLIYGNNRIAHLTQRVLAAHGICDVTLYDGAEPEPKMQRAVNNLVHSRVNEPAFVAPTIGGRRPATTAGSTQDGLHANAFDWAIETSATTESIWQIVQAVRPQGKIILKSRPFRPVELDVRAAVLKELTFHAVNYGSFDAAIELAAHPVLDVDDLLGSTYPLEEFEQILLGAAEAEGTKSFFYLGLDATA